MRKVCFLLLLLSRFITSYAIDTHWDLMPMVIKNGSGNNTIYNICYGSDGFIWLSTDKGITRYDGFRFRDYPLIMSTDSFSVPHHQTVKALHGEKQDKIKASTCKIQCYKNLIFN